MSIRTRGLRINRLKKILGKERRCMIDNNCFRVVYIHIRNAELFRCSCRSLQFAYDTYRVAQREKL